MLRRETNEKRLGPQSLVIPEPVLIIGTYNEDGTPNAMNAAWGGVADYNQIFISLSEHKTTKNIRRLNAFTVSFATKEYMAACDYVGLVSGNKVPDKVERAGFHAVKSKLVVAPIFKELPVTLECVVDSFSRKTGILIGNIVNVSVDSKVMTRGKVDLNKLQPLIYDGLNHNYNVIGEKVGDAFKEGKKIK